MSQGLINFGCFFCGTIVNIPLKNEYSTHYEESQGENGSLYAETFSKPCPKCETMLHVKFKQHQPKRLGEVNSKRGIK